MTATATPTSTDALKIQRHVASLSVSQTEPCRDIGSEAASLFGDVDCSGQVDTVDALKILRTIAGLSANLPAGCPPIGA